MRFLCSRTFPHGIPLCGISACVLYVRDSERIYCEKGRFANFHRDVFDVDRQNGICVTPTRLECERYE